MHLSVVSTIVISLIGLVLVLFFFWAMSVISSLAKTLVKAGLNKGELEKGRPTGLKGFLFMLLIRILTKSVGVRKVAK